jgi:hypothetical protein
MNMSIVSNVVFSKMKNSTYRGARDDGRVHDGDLG